MQNMKTMKMNYKIVWAAAALFGVLSCARMELAPAGDAPEGEALSFTAVWADGEQTKTAIQEDGTTGWWSPYETINMFSSVGEGMFTSTNYTPAESVTFTGQLPITTGSNVIWAAYPYSVMTEFDGAHITMTVPSAQGASAGTFANRLFPAIAKTTDTNLSFLNVCGGAVFSVTQEGVRSVTFQSLGHESLVGTVSVGFDEAGLPRVNTILSGNDTVVVTPPNNGTFEVGKKYYAVFLPGTLSAGLSVTLRTAYQIATHTYEQPITVNRSLFGRLLNVDEDLDYEIEDAQVEADRLSLYDTFAVRAASKGSAFIYSPTRVLFNMCGDDVYAAGSNYGDYDYMAALNEFRYDNGNEVVTNVFLDYYTAINEFNRLINLYQVVDDPGAQRLVAEGRVLRAYLYLLLSAGWGTPPFVDTYNPNFNAGSLVFDLGTTPQKTQAQFYAWCAEECEDALELLDERRSTADVQGAYKVTKGFANAVAGKAYLFAGEYAKAKTALGRVIESGKYALVAGENYWQNFHIEGDGNAEKIFEPNLEYNPQVSAWGGPMQRSTWMESQTWNWRSDCFVATPHSLYTGGVDGWGGLGVPQWFGDEFFKNDGHSYRFDATLKHIDDVVYNMEYRDANINSMTLEQKKESWQIGIKDINHGLYGQSFWLPFKQLVRASDVGPYGINVRLNNFTIMRYAEVLLLYAEACLQTEDAASAKTVINQIQERAGSQTVSETVDMNVLKKEKRYELWLEGSRWFDLLRWGDIYLVNGVVNAGQDVPQLFDKLFREPRETDEKVTWENGKEANSRFYTVSTHKAVDLGYAVGFNPNRHALFPIPYSVREANPALNQNASW